MCGFVLTVLVAWASALWLPNPKLTAVAQARARSTWIPAGHDLEHTFSGTRLGATTWQIQGTNLDTARPAFDSFVTNVGEWGLPMRALGFMNIYDDKAKASVSPAWKRGVLTPPWVSAWAMRLNPNGTVYHAALPIVPLWGGLIVDSVFWGLATFGAARLFAWRRGVRRVRRGKCRRCAYELGDLAACPECGAAP
jgi:hypothetical protein